jgi:hypothetical protein
MPNAARVNMNGLAGLDLGTAGRVLTSDNDPVRGAYGLYIAAITPAATPTDVLTIQGSASKIIRVRQIVLSGAATSATNVQVYLIRRSAANTGGTAAAQTLVKRDTADDAATATVNLYSANPSGLGTAVGTFDGARLNLAPAANGAIDRVVFQYSWLNDKAPALTGASDFFALNFAGAAWPSGGTLDISLTLSED